MKRLAFLVLLYLVSHYCEFYLVELRLSEYPNKTLDFNNTHLGRITIVEKHKKFYLRKHTDYFFYDGTQLKLGGGKTAFKLKKNFFGTQIISEDLCLTVTLGGLDLQKCCTEDEFCDVRQSFSITYLDSSEESSYAETDGKDLVERFKTKYPNFTEIESDIFSY